MITSCKTTESAELADIFAALDELGGQLNSREQQLTALIENCKVTAHKTWISAGEPQQKISPLPSGCSKHRHDDTDGL